MISYVLIPYIGRPLRGQILSLREKEFIEAAIAQGASPLRVMFCELLPNITSLGARLLHADHREQHPHSRPALSFLGAGRAAADAVVGQHDRRRPGRSSSRGRGSSLAPGIAIVLTVLSLNIFGDGLRDALDPRAKVKIEH